ncbi:MAG: glycosyltransferase [Candidatus Latescibacterota bacterium]|nr:MAG: glycosyltransferase [Candidatus Latescibacterota bacterium]
MRLLQVLGYAGAEGGRSGITGVERVVELLLESMNHERFEQSVAYPEIGERFAHFSEHASVVLPCEPRRRYDRVYVQTLARFIAEREIDIVVSHGHRYDFLTTFACRRFRVPHVVSRAVALADEPLPRLRKALYLWVDSWTLRGCQGIIAVSEASKQRIHETQDIPLDKMTVIRNGVRLPEVAAEARRRARRAHGIAEDTLLVGGVGQLIPRKSFDQLVSALGRLSRPDLACVLIGDGPEREPLQRLARDRGVRLLLPGFLSDPYTLMGAFDIAVLPSQAEGLPLVVLESMSLGVPNIATRVAGTPEVIEEGVHGLLVPPADEDALVGALEKLIADEELRQRLGAAGRRRVQDHFSVEAMATGFEECLTRIAAAAPRQAGP